MATMRIHQIHLSRLALTIVSAGACLALAGCFGATYTQDSGPPEVAAPAQTSSTTTTTTDAAPTTVESHRTTTTSGFLIP